MVYGDTDSLFVVLKGASKEHAFRVGKQISERVTLDNPKPVKLKFEKVRCGVVWCGGVNVCVPPLNMCRCIFHVSWRPRKGMLVTVTSLSSKRSQYLMLKE